MLQPDFSSFPEIKTVRLLLRQITKKDAPEILRLRSNEDVMRYIDKERAATIMDAEVFINRILKSLNTNEGITWAIALKEYPETLIGTIGYWRLIKEHYRAEIGYMLNPNHWNKGIMKEALLKVIEVGFNDLKLHSIEAHINPGNAASASILTGAGFVQEAHFKENFFFNGTFRDTAIYSRLQ
ncbi:MAG: GNAT family N-acetyltransferase [Ferruginibacter sp.]|nr:GNAT family N-acetyltransferase [Ferruginibacter sp.]